MMRGGGNRRKGRSLGEEGRREGGLQGEGEEGVRKSERNGGKKKRKKKNSNWFFVLILIRVSKFNWFFVLILILISWNHEEATPLFQLLQG